MPVCATDGCQSPGAYRTRTKPSWCEAHIREMFERGRVRLLDSFTRPNDHLLVECLDCGCQTHMRFVFLQDLLRSDRHGCEACRWRQWAVEARAMANRHLPFPGADEPVDLAVDPVGLPRHRLSGRLDTTARLARLMSVSVDTTPSLGRCPCLLDM